MAKIRTIKPEFFRHESLFEAEQDYQLPLRLAFAGLFSCCDREGRFRWRPRQLKLDILPYDQIDFSRVLDALVTRGFIVKYEVNGEYYGYIPSWHKHQQINHKESASQIPACTDASTLIFPKNDLNQAIHAPPEPPCATREARVSHTLMTENTLYLQTDGNTRGEMELEMEVEREMEKEVEQEGQGKGSGNVDVRSHRREADANSNPVTHIFNHWKQVMEHPKAVLDKSRRKSITTALTMGYTVDELCEAITGCSYTPHNMGANEHGEHYDGLHIIFKDANQIDRFRKNFAKPPRPPNPAEQRISANVQTAQTWLAQSMERQEVTVHG